MTYRASSLSSNSPWCTSMIFFSLQTFYRAPLLCKLVFNTLKLVLTHNECFTEPILYWNSLLCISNALFFFSHTFYGNCFPWKLTFQCFGCLPGSKMCFTEHVLCLDYQFCTWVLLSASQTLLTKHTYYLLNLIFECLEAFSVILFILFRTGFPFKFAFKHFGTLFWSLNIWNREWSLCVLIFQCFEALSCSLNEVYIAYSLLKFVYRILGLLLFACLSQNTFSILLAFLHFLALFSS